MPLLVLECSSQVSGPNANRDAKLIQHRKKNILSFEEAHLKGDKFFSMGECFGYLPKETAGLPPSRSTRVIEGISFEVGATIWKDDDRINL